MATVRDDQGFKRRFALRLCAYVNNSASRQPFSPTFLVRVRGVVVEWHAEPTLAKYRAQLNRTTGLTHLVDRTAATLDCTGIHRETVF